MQARIKADELPETVLEAFGAIANHGRLRVREVEYRAQQQLVTFPMQRFAITGTSFWSGTRHSADPVACRVTIRGVTACEIKNTGDCEEIEIIFGIAFPGGEVYLCSAQESRGKTCYALRCRVSGIDIELHDEQTGVTAQRA